ncbi:MAG: 16S rRNA (guanine(527)-N(7))-methyltransferase RsmG [Salinisphaeraceae bacterium]|nr:16S rRNA (guanine(527)-N(7))-methyltransferase RsmG [Salinisphaeraceae bacterium]
MNDTDWKTSEDLLADGIADLAVSVSARAQKDMIRYLQELVAWNRSYNLTAIREPAQMVVKHLLDSLAVLPYLGEGRSLLDVGTGAGIPGLVLAMCMPRMEVTVLDSNGKKAAFLRHCVRSLELKNVQVAQTRVEDYRPQSGFATVISRAFAALDAFTVSAGHCCADSGQMLAMLGTKPEDSVLQAVSGFSLQRLEVLNVPGLAAERHIAVLSRSLI